MTISLYDTYVNPQGCPPVTHDFGNVSGTKLLLEPDVLSGNFNSGNRSSQVSHLEVIETVTKFLFKSNFNSTNKNKDWTSDRIPLFPRRCHPLPCFPSRDQNLCRLATPSAIIVMAIWHTLNRGRHMLRDPMPGSNPGINTQTLLKIWGMAIQYSRHWLQ